MKADKNTAGGRQSVRFYQRLLMYCVVRGVTGGASRAGTGSIGNRSMYVDPRLRFRIISVTLEAYEDKLLLDM